MPYTTLVTTPPPTLISPPVHHVTTALDEGQHSQIGVHESSVPPSVLHPPKRLGVAVESISPGRGGSDITGQVDVPEGPQGNPQDRGGVAGMDFREVSPKQMRVDEPAIGTFPIPRQ